MQKNHRAIFGGWLLIAAAIFGLSFTAQAQRQMEHLGRGMIALRTSSTQTYIGWRLLGNDPSDVGFNLYRAANAGVPVKLNSLPLTNTTDYVDTPANLSTTAYTYSVRPVINGVEVPDTFANPLGQSNATLSVNATIRQYFPVALQPPPVANGNTYKVKFCWVGDFDGDGEYDFVVDRYNPVLATNEFLEAYKRDGTFLWRMDMGYNSVNQYNIEPGSSSISIGHGDNVTAFDLDGDGKAEVIVRTAKGVIFADNSVVGGTDDRVQYLSILDGMTGKEKARATIPNPYLSDGQMNGHMGVLYCDGVRPSVFWQASNRRADLGFNDVATTWDYRDGVLTQRWTRDFDTLTHSATAHQIRFADTTHSGKDDYLDIGHGLKDDGTQLYAMNEVIHGDRFHTTDIDPERPGLETFLIQQNNGSGLATAFIDPSNGKIIKKWYAGSVVDVGRGVAGDFDPSSKGCEFFSTQPNIYDDKGNVLYTQNPFPPETIWWDGDLSREFVATVGSTAESPAISKFYATDPGNLGRIYTIYNETPPGVYQAYGGRPQFWGDLFGDWREEYLCVANDNSEMRIYTTKIPSSVRLYTLMHNGQYRDQTTVKGYVQSSYVDYYLGNGMEPPVPAPYSNARLVWRGDGTNTWDAGSTANWMTNNVWVSNTIPGVYNPGDTVLFDMTGSNNTAINLASSLTPGEVTVYSPKNFTFGGSGSLGGSMKLTKAGAGKLIFSGTNNYTGATLIAEGPFVVNGFLPSSPVTVRGGVWLDGRLGGSGVVGSAVTLRPGAGLSPGAGTNAPGTLTISNNVSMLGLTLSDFDLSDDATGTVKSNDLAIITGNLTLTGTNTFVIHKLNATLPPGVYPLINYSGTFSGNLNALRVSGLEGVPVTFTNPPGQIALVVKSVRSAATLTWTGGTGGNAWDLAVSSNWLNSAAKDVFVPQDAVRFDNTGSSNLTVNLSDSLIASSVIVDSTANYTLAGSGAILGNCSLVKSNTGTLTITALNNNFTGPTRITGGMVVVSELDAVGFPSPLGNAGANPTNLVLSGNATLRVTGESYTDRGMTLSAGTNSIDIFNGSDQLTIANNIVGSGALQKLGGGTLAFTASNSYSGGTMISGGSIVLGGADGSGNRYGLGTGSVTFSNGTLSYLDLEAGYTYAHTFILLTNATGRIDCDGRSTMTGSLTGSGTFTVMTPYVRTDFNGNWSAFSGQLNLTSDADGGSFRINNSAGLPNTKVNVGNLVSFQNRVGGTPTISIGELSGVAGANISGGTGNDGVAVNWSVGGLNTSATYAGSTYNNAGFIKVGTGTWTWTSTNITHTGPTTINGGTLLYNGIGSNSTSVVTVGAAGTLGGTGIIGGVTTVNGKLAPGNNAIGTITFNNNVTLANGSTTLIKINKTAGTRDLVDGNATITYGGTLSVTNLAGTPASGDSFKIFDAVTYAGSFTTLSLPPLNPGLAWNTTALSTSGTLSVISDSNAVPPAAPSGLIATTVSSSQINLSWSDNSTNENNFLIESSTDNTNFVQIGSVGIDVTNYPSTGLAASTTYYFRVRANNSAGNSAYSATANATTLTPPPGIVWHGDGVANAWDIGVSSNWSSAGNLVQFANGAGVTFDDSGSNNVAVTLTGTPQPAGIIVSATKNYTFAGTGSIGGTNGLVKAGSGQLTLNTTNAFSGGIVISNGTLITGTITPTANVMGTGPVTFMGGTLQFNGYGGNTGTSWGGSTNALIVPAGQTGTMLLPPRWGYSAPFTSPLTGGGTLNLTVDFIRDYFSGNWSAFTGQINVSPRSGTGDFRIDNANGYASVAFYLNNSVNFYNINANNQTTDLGELGGASGAYIGAGSSSSTGPTWRIGAKNTSSTYAGTIADSGVTSVTKIGTGTLTLSGANTYSGVTTISGGTLQFGDGGVTGTVPTNNIVNNATLAFNRADAINDRGIISGTGNLRQLGDGVLTFTNAHTYTGVTTIESGTLALVGNGSIANSTNINISVESLLDVSARTGGGMTLTSGKILNGNGAVKGNFTIASGAKLAPGNSIGTLTFSNALTLSAGCTNIFEVSASGAHDQANVVGNLTCGGILVVTNIGGSPLVAGNSFQLFNAPSQSGLFSSVVLPPLGTNLVWDTSSLAVNGTIVVNSTAPVAFNSVVPLADGNFRLTFSGPANQAYELRATTNLSLQPVTLWDLLDSGTFGNAPLTFTDLQATNYLQRFYQIRLP